MKFKVQIEKGARAFDLSGGDATIDDRTFSPPSGGRGRRGVEGAVEWEFDVHISGDTPLHAQRILRELNLFLQQPQSEQDPVYIAVRSSGYGDGYFDTEPSFGQGLALTRYRVLDANTVVGREFTTPLTASNKIVEVTLRLLIEDTGYGLPQPVGIGQGNLGVKYIGLDRNGGLIFNHTGGGSSLDGFTTTNGTQTIIRDPKYLVQRNYSYLYEQTSATYRASRVTRDISGLIGAGATTVTWGFLFRGVDSDAAITGLRAYNNGAYVTPTQYALADGWWFFQYSTSITTGGAAYHVGLALDYPKTMIIAGSFFSTGDTTMNQYLPQNFFTKTAVTSPGILDYPQRDLIMTPTQATIRFALFSFEDTTTTASLLYSSNSLRLETYYSGAQRKVRVSINGGGAWALDVNSNISTPATTAQVYHLTIDQLSSTVDYRLYENGTFLQGATSVGAVIPAPTGGNWSIGEGGTETSNVELLGLTVFPGVMDATEVALDAAQVLPIAQDRYMTDSIPVLWTENGDGTVDNEGTPNHAALMNVDGDSADLELRLLASKTSDNFGGFIIGQLGGEYEDIDADMAGRFGASAASLYVTGVGTADTAADSNTTERQAVSTSVVEFVDSVEDDRLYRACAGKQVSAYVALKDAGSNLQIRLKASLGAASMYTEWRDVTASGSYYGFLLPAISIPDSKPTMNAVQKLGFAIEARRTTGSANLDVSHAIYLVDPVIVDLTQIESPASVDGVLIRNGDAAAVYSPTSDSIGLGKPPAPIGRLNPYPNGITLMHIIAGADGEAYDPDVVTTVAARVTPRWSIL